MSAPALLHVIDLFSNFSGNKINLAKSENVPLGGLNAIPAALPSTPQVVSSRFPVPIFITPKFKKMHESNTALGFFSSLLVGICIPN